ncbi:hypothetical protein ACFPRL_21170 [Pseudoclavibacter helvolus]
MTQVVGVDGHEAQPLGKRAREFEHQTFRRFEATAHRLAGREHPPAGIGIGLRCGGRFPLDFRRPGRVAQLDAHHRLVAPRVHDGLGVCQRGQQLDLEGDVVRRSAHAERLEPGTQPEQRVSPRRVRGGKRPLPRHSKLDRGAITDHARRPRLRVVG